MILRMGAQDLRLGSQRRFAVDQRLKMRRRNHLMYHADAVYALWVAAGGFMGQ